MVPAVCIQRCLRVRVAISSPLLLLLLLLLAMLFACVACRRHEVASCVAEAGAGLETKVGGGSEGRGEEGASMYTCTWDPHSLVRFLKGSCMRRCEVE